MATRDKKGKEERGVDVWKDLPGAEEHWNSATKVARRSANRSTSGWPGVFRLNPRRENEVIMRPLKLM